MENRFLGLIEKSVKVHWDLPAFTDMEGSTLLYKDVARRMEELHILFRCAEIQPGDKIAILGRNSSNWALSFFGTLTYGAVAVPILHEFKADNIHLILNHSESKVLFVSASNWAQLDEKEFPQIRLIIQLDDFSLIKSNRNIRRLLPIRFIIMKRIRKIYAY